MTKEHQPGQSSAMHEIDKKIRLSIAVIAFVVITLFAIILYHLYPEISQSIDFLPAVSINLILGISFMLSLIGLYLSVHMSQDVSRIIHDYSNKLERMLSITRDLREEI